MSNVDRSTPEWQEVRASWTMPPGDRGDLVADNVIRTRLLARAVANRESGVFRTALGFTPVVRGVEYPHETTAEAAHAVAERLGATKEAKRTAAALDEVKRLREENAQLRATIEAMASRKARGRKGSAK